MSLRTTELLPEQAPVAISEINVLHRFLPVALAAIIGCSPAASTTPAKVAQQVQPTALPVAGANPTPAPVAPQLPAVAAKSPPKANPFIYSWIPGDFNRAQVYDDSFPDRYLGKEVEIRGFVSDPVVVPRNELPFQVVDEGGKDADHPVICVFSAADVPVLRQLQDNAPIVIHGTCAKFDEIKGIKLVNCKVVSP
jgi:hypothetical protein